MNDILARLEASLPEGEGRGWYLPRLLEMLKPHKLFPLEIFETGTVNLIGEDAKFGHGWSTFYLAEWARENGACLTSVDSRGGIQDDARKVLIERGLLPHVKLVLSDSRTALWERKTPIDFLYLDSDPGEVCLAEFLMGKPLLRLPALVVIDDVFDCNRLKAYPLGGFNKANMVCELLKSVYLPTHQLGRMLVLEFSSEPIV